MSKETARDWIARVNENRELQASDEPECDDATTNAIVDCAIRLLTVYHEVKGDSRPFKSSKGEGVSALIIARKALVGEHDKSFEMSDTLQAAGYGRGWRLLKAARLKELEILVANRFYVDLGLSSGAE